jgi:retron-type reverse transcriptase
MKRFDTLYHKIYAFDNLLRAFKQAEKGKRYNENVVSFRFRLEENLFKLEEELKNETYTPGNYTTFHIYEPKKRMISAAPFRDRVVHHALCNIIEPLFEPTLIHDTYANRKGKGTHAAIRKAQKFGRKQDWVLKCDIKKYFPSIDHQILKNLIAQKIECPQTLALIYRIIDNSNPQELVQDYFRDDNLFTIATRRIGLPMGNLTSQFFANLYLSPLDHFIKEQLQVKGYVRYVDDFIVFGDNNAELQAKLIRINHFLEKLRLKIHPKKCHTNPAALGVSFCGQQIFNTHRLLRSDNVRRFWKRLKVVFSDFKNRKMGKSELENRLNAWKGHAMQANTFRLCRRIYNQVNFAGILLLERRNGSWVVL